MKKQLIAPNNNQLSVQFVFLCLFTISNAFSPLYYLGSSFAHLPIILAILTASLLFLSLIWPRNHAVHLEKPTTLLLILVFIAVYFTFFRTVDMIRSKLIFNSFYKNATLFLLISHVITNMKQLKVYLAILGFCAFALAYKLVHYPIWAQGRAWVEGTAFSGDPNIISVFFVFSLPLVIALGVISKKHLIRLVLIYIMATLLLAIIEAESRGAFVALLTMSCFGIYQIKNTKQRIITTIIVIIIGSMFFARYAPRRYIERMGEIISPATDRTGSAQLRQSAMLVTFDYVITHPFSEYGLGNHSYLIVKEYGVDPSDLKNVFSGSYLCHNIFLQLGADLGLVPLLLYLSFIWSLFKCTMIVKKRALSSHRSDPAVLIISQCLAISLCGYLAGSFFLAGVYQPFLFYIGGCCLALYKIHNNSSTKGVDR